MAIFGMFSQFPFCGENWDSKPGHMWRKLTIRTHVNLSFIGTGLVHVLVSTQMNF